MLSTVQTLRRGFSILVAIASFIAPAVAGEETICTSETPQTGGEGFAIGDISASPSNSILGTVNDNAGDSADSGMADSDATRTLPTPG